jgi:transposase
MKKPIFVRAVSEHERAALRAGLRAAEAFTLRRSQILLASAAGQTPRQIARQFGCGDQTVRNVLRAFAREGVTCLHQKSSRPKTSQPILDAANREKLHGLLHQSPRTFGKPRSTWTLLLVAEVCFEQGLTPHQVSDETIRTALRRLNVHWKRAKDWINSPDPAYVRKKKRATG